MRTTTLALVALLLGPAGCGGDPEVAEPTAPAPPVMVAPVEAHRVVEEIQAAGDLIAKEEATVSAEVGGVVTEILLDEGEAVEKGTVVLEIDPERRELELQSRKAGVARAQAGLREQERETRRIETLGTRNVASQAQRDEAETELQRARSELAEARAQLGLAERASFFKNNIDHYTGATFGCHENYLVRRDVPFNQVLLPAIRLAEEGFPVDQLESVLDSMARADDEAGVEIVTGDTKVVPRGSAGGMFINTSGIGLIEGPSGLPLDGIAEGDRILVSGPVDEAAGTSLNGVIALGDEDKGIAVMERGAAKIAQELYSSGKFHGVIALGGTMGT